MQTEAIEIVEVVAPHVIEAGDSVKVKQVFDDSLQVAVVDAGYEIHWTWENIKLSIMALSCVFAMVAQFYPIPFPDSRPLLGACCAIYFILSGVLQYIMTFIDKDTILFTKPNKTTKDELRIRTAFTRFQEYFSLIVEDRNDSSRATTAKMYVGRYFTLKGEYDEERFKSDVKMHIKLFEQRKYCEFTYDHKSD